MPTLGPQKLCDNKCMLFKVTKFVVMWYTAIKTKYNKIKNNNLPQNTCNFYIQSMLIDLKEDWMMTELKSVNDFVMIYFNSLNLHPV